MLDSVQKSIDTTIDTALQDDAASGTYRVSRDIFTDPELFELEMKHIFEGNWIYLAHESQIPNNNDYFTGHIGRQPIFIARNRAGELYRFRSILPSGYGCPPNGRRRNCSLRSGATASARRTSTSSSRGPATAS